MLSGQPILDWETQKLKKIKCHFPYSFYSESTTLWPGKFCKMFCRVYFVWFIKSLLYSFMKLVVSEFGPPSGNRKNFDPVFSFAYIYIYIYMFTLSTKPQAEASSLLVKQKQRRAEYKTLSAVYYGWSPLPKFQSFEIDLDWLKNNFKWLETCHYSKQKRKNRQKTHFFYHK